MPKPPKPEDIVASAQANGLSRYELDLQSGRLKVDGPEDHALAMDALARILRRHVFLHPSSTIPRRAQLILG